jgi:hypothetical protein
MKPKACIASKELLHTLLIEHMMEKNKRKIKSSDETNDANETSDWEAGIDSSGVNHSIILNNEDEENEAIRESSEM